MEFKLRSYPCPCCKEQDTKKLLMKQGFAIVKCSNCNFVFVNPRVADEELAFIYSHNYFQNKDYGYVSYEQEKRLRIKNFERWLKDAQPFLPPGKPVTALDVGCAAGYCLEVMKNNNWTADGLELDEKLCNELQAAGFYVTPQMLQNFESQGKYSLITLFDVIEHIPAIDAAFSQLNKLLADDGIIVIVTPDHGSFQRKLFGKRWFQYKPIEHIQYFTKETLEVFATRNGLQMIFHSGCGQYADTEFILNRLKYYHFDFIAGFFRFIFKMIPLRKRFFYTGTGSIYAIFKKK
ncbi:MAG: class I SAM-dependent methyltransferase [Ferruginibacter sp.]